MTPVEQLGDDGRWYVQFAAIWHWYLPLIIYIMFFIIFIVSVHSFFTIVFNQVLINLTGWQYQHVLALGAFLTVVVLKGLTLRSFLFDVCKCMLCFMFV